jgi:hypothetical protein
MVFSRSGDLQLFSQSSIIRDSHYPGTYRGNVNMCYLSGLNMSVLRIFEIEYLF